MRNKIGVMALAAALIFAPFTTLAAYAAPDDSTTFIDAQDEEPTAEEEKLFNRGQDLFVQGRHEQAAAVFQDFLKTYPNSVITDLILLWLGRSYMQVGKLQEAEQVGQRLRAIKDTPFIEIYDSELQVARTERRNTPAAITNTTTSTRTSAAPPVLTANARPTPTPVSRRRQPQPSPAQRTAVRTTPTLTVLPTPTPEIAATSPLNTTRGRRSRRSRTVNQPARTNEQTAALSNTAPAIRPPVSRPLPTPTPTPVPVRQSQRARNPQVATNTTTPTRLPVATPTPARSVPSSNDPALQVANNIDTSDPSPSQSGGSGGGGTGLSFTVKQVPNLQLSLRRASLAASPGQVVQLPLVVTNSGNKEDQFRIETDLPAEFQPTFSQAQGGTDTGLPILVTPQLARGASLDVLLNIRIPENAPDSRQHRFIVRAASQSDNEVMRVSDASLTVVAAALAATSDVKQETVMPGETFSQSISVRNQGSAQARSARADFVFNPEFELVSANPSPLVYDRASRTAIWSLGDLDPREGRDITVNLRAVSDALASVSAPRALGRGTMRTASLNIPSNFDGPVINIGRIPRARIDAVSTGLTATPGDTIYIPFVVRNPGNYAESYNLRIISPGAPSGTIFADTNGDGRHQDSEPTVTQTTALEPRGGQFPLLLRVEIPRSTPDRQQFAYNLVTRAASQNSIAGEAGTVLTVVTPRVRVRTEQVTTEVVPGETIFYRLVLVNDGGGLAKNLTVTENLPEAMEFVSSDPSLDTQDAPGGAHRFTWRVVELAPGDTTVLLVTVRLKPSLRAGDEITPRHTLSYQDTNGNSYTGQ
ncbi:MAG TPA: tetratricopeptide repeat protein [Pyrinomonadaceae bacterium]|jgi:uncharacterized repeat protein (TIGR01451 family)